jgi:hypothetical protein
MGVLTLFGLVLAAIAALWALVSGAEVSPLVASGAVFLVLALAVSGLLAAWLRD